MEVISVSVVNGALNVEVKSDMETRWCLDVGQVFCYETLCHEVEHHGRVTDTVLVELRV